jgi:3',5'-cyclic AMP phosphodiesterase CpdA
MDQASQPLQAPWNFSVIALPDTQLYSQSYPAIFTNQTQWIVDTAASLNTVFVTHEGDIVNTYSATSQWNNANSSMSKLDGIVPWAVLPGNHDGNNVGGTGENLVNYNTYFPFSRFSGQPWYGGAYNNVNSNSFELFSGGADDYLIFHFQYHPSNAVLAWANATIADYPGRRVIVTTHDYMNVDDSRTTEGDHIWNSFVAAHADQVFLVLCGHMHTSSDGEARRTDFVNGHAVYQLMANFQDYPNGGNSRHCRRNNCRPNHEKLD